MRSLYNPNREERSKVLKNLEIIKKRSGAERKMEVERLEVGASALSILEGIGKL